MSDVDASTIVPSTRDLLQVIGTRRRNLALLGLISAERPAEEAARLADLNISAFACVEAGPAMAAVARATKTVPALCLDPASEKAHILAARQFGSDGVAIDGALPLDDWDRVAKIARSMRMLPIALARDPAGMDGSLKAGAKAILIRAASAAAVLDMAARAPRSLTLIGMVDDGDAAAVRALAGKVDAAVVPPQIHTSREFRDLVAEVDP